jgi:hypothetical protein
MTRRRLGTSIPIPKADVEMMRSITGSLVNAG